MAIANSAGARIRERIFVMWEEAGRSPDLAYRLWHRMRPMLKGEATADARQGGQGVVPPAKAKDGKTG